MILRCFFNLRLMKYDWVLPQDGALDCMLILDSSHY